MKRIDIAADFVCIGVAKSRLNIESMLNQAIVNSDYEIAKILLELIPSMKKTEQKLNKLGKDKPDGKKEKTETREKNH